MKYSNCKIFNYSETDMPVDVFELQIFITKKKIDLKNYKYWESLVFENLKIPVHDRVANDCDSITDGDDSKQSGFTTDSSDTQVFPVANNYIWDFWTKFKENNPNYTVYQPDLNDFEDPCSLLKTRKKSAFPLKEVKLSNISDWSCPKFNLPN